MDKDPRIKDFVQSFITKQSKTIEEIITEQSETKNYKKKTEMTDFKTKHGIFAPIEISHEQRDFEARVNYNRMAFLAELMIDVVDTLKGTNQYKFNLKKACNEVLAECEKIVGLQLRAYENHGNVENEGKEIHALNVYTITGKAYEQAFKMFAERKPNEIVSIMELIRRFEESGNDLSNIRIEYEPVKL